MDTYDIEFYKKLFLKNHIESLDFDSRRISKNSMFIALTGSRSDGHDFIVKAYENGARIFVVEKDCDFLPEAIRKDITLIKVDNTRSELSKIAKAFYDDDRELKIIGVTGTKGKTSVASILYQVLNSAGLPTGIIGTNGVEYGDIKEETMNTTPESLELHRIIKRMKDAGINCLVMEVSSQALKFNRVDDIDFTLGLFTNLSRDHISPLEHPDFEDYKHSKMRFFTMAPIIANADDEHFDELFIEKPYKTYAMNNEADFKIHDIEMLNEDGKHFMQFFINDMKIKTNLIGRFNAYNIAAAVGAIVELGIDMKCLDHMTDISIPGRMEVFHIAGRTVVLDYAHNGVSMEECLSVLRHLRGENKIITVFGTVGGRAESRRKDLAEVCDKLADLSIITTDDPNFEDPMKIAKEVSSFYKDESNYKIEIDREEAIRDAYRHSVPGDIILIAGKGREKYMKVRGKKIPYSDFDVIEKLISEHG